MVKANDTQNDVEEKRCLLVEDSTKAESNYMELLQHFGFSTKIAYNKKEALELLEGWTPHVILVHFTEDTSRSINFIKEVTQKDSTICTIYNTAYNDASVLEDALNSGAFWVLKKPFIDKELEVLVNHAYKENMRRRNSLLLSSYVFVLMPFSEKFNKVYQQAIKKPLISKGLICERADEIQDTGGIMEQVFNRIRRARFIVADMTGRNANVFYEVGYAHAIGKDVILLTQKKEDVPFDLRGYYHIKYGDSIKDLKKMLLEKVDALLSKVV